VDSIDISEESFSSGETAASDRLLTRAELELKIAMVEKLLLANDSELWAKSEAIKRLELLNSKQMEENEARVSWLEAQLREQSKHIEYLSGISLGAIPEYPGIKSGCITLDLRAQAFRIKELSAQKESIEASFVTLWELVTHFNAKSKDQVDIPGDLNEQYHILRAQVMRECYTILEHDFLTTVHDLQASQTELKTLQLRFESQDLRCSSMVSAAVFCTSKVNSWATPQLLIYFQELDLMRAKHQIQDLNEKPPHLVQHALLVKFLQKEIESQQKLIQKLGGPHAATSAYALASETDWPLRLLNVSSPVSPPNSLLQSLSPKELSNEIESLQKAFAKINATTTKKPA